MQGLKTRILDQFGMKKQILLEVLVQKESYDIGVVASYPEINGCMLKTEIRLFHLRYEIKSLKDATEVLTSMTKEVKLLFSNVEVLVRLMMVCPASSCETIGVPVHCIYLRSILGTQKRLNRVTICYVHKLMFNLIQTKNVAKKFISNCESRRDVVKEK